MQMQVVQVLLGCDEFEIGPDKDVYPGSSQSCCAC